MSQKALIVRTGPDGHEGLDELNIELERGWRVAEMGPMGGATGPTPGPSHAALVVLEEAREVVDGNGADPLNAGEPPCDDPDEVE